MKEITSRQILKTHGFYFLAAYYDFEENKISEKSTLITQLTHLRPLIEYYQKETNDIKGNAISLDSRNLKSEYFSACKMIHPESHIVQYKPKELKDDFKAIYKSLFGKKEYKKLNRQVKNIYCEPKSLLSLLKPKYNI